MNKKQTIIRQCNAISTGYFRGCLGTFLIMISVQANAVTLSFDKLTSNSQADYSSLLFGDLASGANQSLLNLQNATGGQGRISSVFIQDQGNALGGVPVSGTLILEDPGGAKLNVVKVVKAITGLGLKESKDLVDNAPSEILITVPLDVAEAARTSLAEAGATVSVDEFGKLPNITLDATIPSGVVLDEPGGAKLNVVKAVKTITGLGLKESKELVDNAPSVIEGSGLTPEQIKNQLEQAGATVILTGNEPVGLEILNEGITLPGGATSSESVVTLVAPGGAKLNVVKVVKTITGLGLKESKELVDNAPSVIESSAYTPEQIRSLLEEAGAEVELVVKDFDQDYQLLLDYRGSDSNPDLLFMLGLEVSFQNLLGMLESGEFRLDLEITDGAGSDLYRVSADLSDVSAVPVPPMMLPMALCLLAMGYFQRRKTVHAGSRLQ